MNMFRVSWEPLGRNATREEIEFMQDNFVLAEDTGTLYIDEDAVDELSASGEAGEGHEELLVLLKNMCEKYGGAFDLWLD